MEGSNEPKKVFTCPSCRYQGDPIFLKKTGTVLRGQKDYSDVPFCPRCRNEWIWRNVPQMREE
jgi:hypothetical protein